jgi:hypothetical protein
MPSVSASASDGQVARVERWNATAFRAIRKVVYLPDDSVLHQRYSEVDEQTNGAAAQAKICSELH